MDPLVSNHTFYSTKKKVALSEKKKVLSEKKTFSVPDELLVAAMFLLLVVGHELDQRCKLYNT